MPLSSSTKEKVCATGMVVDARAFDEEVAEPVFPGEVDHHEVFPQGAADAPVAHFHELFLGPGQGVLALDEVGVDVDLAHVADDDRDLEVVLLCRT